jgi:hypothetical protein
VPEDPGPGLAAPGDVPGLLALWAVAAENDSQPGDTARAALALLERDPGACLIARQGTASSGRSSRAGTDGARTCNGWPSIQPRGAGASAGRCSTRGQRD